MSSIRGVLNFAKFFRYALIGTSALVLLFLPYKVLQFVGFGPLLGRSHKLVEAIGAPATIGYLLAVALALAAVAALGWLLMVLARPLARRIPLLRIFVRTAERFDGAFESDATRTPTQVVLVGWPNDNVRSVGMVMRQSTDPATNRTVATVYIPNTPNPLTGMLRMVDAEKLEPTDWTVDDVFALTFSHGTLSPRGRTAAD